MEVRNLLLFPIVIAYLSCSTNSGQNKKNNIFSINIKNAKRLNLNAVNLVKEIEYIPIKEHKNIYINRIDKLQVHENNMFLKPKNQSIIFVFSDKGDFLYKINNIGEGPLQFSNIQDFTIDKNYLYLSEMGNLKILKYDLVKKEMVKE